MKNYLVPLIGEKAREFGYAIALHGSMHLVAIPWTEDARSAEELVEAIREEVGGFIIPTGTKGGRPDGNGGYIEVEVENPAKKPHGRLAWNIHLECGPFIDLSVMPRAEHIAENVK